MNRKRDSKEIKMLNKKPICGIMTESLERTRYLYISTITPVVDLETGTEQYAIIFSKKIKITESLREFAKTNNQMLPLNGDASLAQLTIYVTKEEIKNYPMDSKWELKVVENGNINLVRVNG